MATLIVVHYIEKASVIRLLLPQVRIHESSMCVHR